MYSPKATTAVARGIRGESLTIQVLIPFTYDHTQRLCEWGPVCSHRVSKRTSLLDIRFTLSPIRHLAKMSSAPVTTPQRIVIIGGGIAGISTAYYLTCSPSLPSGSSITIVEGTDIASAASGKSGGFLAKDWHGAATASLSAMSYDLHADLAKEYGGKEKWGYRVVDTLVRAP